MGECRWSAPRAYKRTICQKTLKKIKICDTFMNAFSNNLYPPPLPQVLLQIMERVWRGAFITLNIKYIAHLGDVNVS